MAVAVGVLVEVFVGVGVGVMPVPVTAVDSSESPGASRRMPDGEPVAFPAPGASDAVADITKSDAETLASTVTIMVAVTVGPSEG